ncbi:MAG: hypothetical protein LBV30_08160 [Propionibacteriaceae bacterium]|jgi:hypothetical protein|nr:hypothetical protein [Propionibacteriaceae bacterium]
MPDQTPAAIHRRARQRRRRWILRLLIAAFGLLVIFSASDQASADPAAPTDPAAPAATVSVEPIDASIAPDDVLADWTTSAASASSDPEAVDADSTAEPASDSSTSAATNAAANTDASATPTGGADADNKAGNTDLLWGIGGAMVVILIFIGWRVIVSIRG